MNRLIESLLMKIIGILYVSTIIYFVYKYMCYEDFGLPYLKFSFIVGSLTICMHAVDLIIFFQIYCSKLFEEKYGKIKL